MWGTPAAAHSRDQIIKVLFLNPDLNPDPYKDLVATATVLIAHRPRPRPRPRLDPSGGVEDGDYYPTSSFSFVTHRWHSSLEWLESLLNLRSLQYSPSHRQITTCCLSQRSSSHLPNNFHILSPHQKEASVNPLCFILFCGCSSLAIMSTCTHYSLLLLDAFSLKTRPP